MTPGSLGFQNVKLIADGTAAFTRGVDMVNDGVVEKMLIEGPRRMNSEPDPFEVSDADTMVQYLTSVVGDKKEELVYNQESKELDLSFGLV
jgi:peroxiredoxin